MTKDCCLKATKVDYDPGLTVRCPVCSRIWICGKRYDANMGATGYGWYLTGDPGAPAHREGPADN